MRSGLDPNSYPSGVKVTDKQLAELRISKWNKIEHRLFSFISQNWRGKPRPVLDVVAAMRLIMTSWLISSGEMPFTATGTIVCSPPETE